MLTRKGRWLPISPATSTRLLTTKDELWLESQGQIDLYDDPKLIVLAADAVAVFLR